MAINYKVLGQANPAGTSETDLYTVPADTQAVVSTLTLSNVSGSNTNARVWVRVAGASTANSNAIMYDVPVAANSIAAFTLGLTLASTDIVTVRQSNGGNLTFQLFGSEITA
jgi:hypothetical protein